MDHQRVFRARRVDGRRPDAVRVGYDFGAWCVELRRFGSLVVRRPAVSEADARAEAVRLSRAGLRLLPDAPRSLPIGEPVMAGGA